MAFYNNVIAGASGASGGTGAAGYEISRSLRFNSGDSAHLSRVPVAAGNRRTWTWSGWVKRAVSDIDYQNIFCAGDSGVLNRSFIRFNSSPDDGLLVLNSDSGWNVTSNAVYRDPSAWYHIVVALDTTQATAADRLRLWVNGVSETLTGTYPTLNEQGSINNTKEHFIGKETYTSGREFDGYLANVDFIDGQALAPTYFGEYDSNNVWQPKKFAGSYASATLYSPYATNPSSFNGSAHNLFDGDLTTSWQNSDTSGNTYASVDLTQGGTTTGVAFTTSFEMYGAFSYNQVLEIDHAGGTHTYNGNPGGSGAYVDFASDLTSPVTAIRFKDSGGTGTPSWNAIRVDGTILTEFGLNSFKLDFSDNSSNEALGYDSSVDSPVLNNKGGFDAVLYTGTGSNQTIEGLAFQPDLVWIKTRNEAENHFIVDSVRGVTNQLYANQAGQEYTNANRFKAFNPNGFTVGTTDDTNQSGNSFVAWAWKAGGPSVSNTSGSITSSVSADNTYGFSVVSYTGATGAQTVGHGLSSAPKFIIAKNRDSSSDWIVYHEDLDSSNPEDKFLRLNQTNSTSTSADYWGSGGVTNSVFGVDNGILINTNSQKVIAYCWSEVSGYSKFGSYSGSSSSDVTVTTGFKPRFILIKSTDTAGQEWIIKDSVRGGDKYLHANDTNAEATGRVVTFNSDGFTLAHSQGPTNYDGRTYVYAAFGDRDGNNWATNNLIATAGLKTANQGMDVVTYTGNGGTQSISSLNFQPDFVWIKGRDWGGHHSFTDSVRGATKVLYSNLTNAEGTNTGMLSAFNSNGFTVGSDNDVNKSGQNYVAWAWKAGGTASSNSDGSITSSVSANQTYGFSICNYVGNATSGATFGHGLGSVPKMVIIKSRDSGHDWIVYHESTGNTGALRLNGTNVVDTNIKWFNNTSPSSSVFTLGNTGGTNANGDNMVAYCWSEIAGFSRFGGFTGNGSTNGPVITTGFKPRWVMIKETGNAANWFIYDSVRGTTNILWANTTDSESTIGSGDGTNQNGLTINSTGFSIPHSLSGTNRNGGTYIYAAFADKPPGEIIDSLIDTPTNYEADSGNNGGNYATLNPLEKSSDITLSNGNLDASYGSGSGWRSALGTFDISSGKWYFEFTLTENRAQVGICGNGTTRLDTYLESDSTAYVVQTNNGTLYTGSSGGVSTGLVWGVGDVVNIAYDADNTSIWFGKNGTWSGSGNPSAGTGATHASAGPGATGRSMMPGISLNQTSACNLNFGQRPFAISSIPTGYKSLCTTNLPDPTIADGSTAFDVKLWTGNATARSITMDNSSMSPDFVWIKARNNTSWHYLFNSVVGVGKELFSNANNAENASSTTLTSYDSNGFSLGTDGGVNQNTKTFVGWAWDAGSSNTSISVGGLNSSVYNQSQTWSDSNNLSGDIRTTGTVPANMFNGILGGEGDAGAICFAAYVSNGSMTWTSPVTFNNLNSLRLWLDKSGSGAGYLRVNGVNYDSSVTDGWVTIPESSLSTIEIGYTGGFNTATGVGAVEVNGQLLIDSGVSVTNVPTIASTVRANPSAGFSIVRYVGAGAAATIGHGLNASPDIVFFKPTSSAGDWMVYTDVIDGSLDYVKLNAADAKNNSTWTDLLTSTNVLEMEASSTAINSSGVTYIAFCWSEVSGFSKFGTYSGNGSTDGPFVYTGFRPRWIMFKRTDSTSEWRIHDTAREAYNPLDSLLFPSLSDAETTNSVYRVDVLSNGFKVRNTNDNFNASNGDYLYVAFAEHPFKTARAR